MENSNILKKLFYAEMSVSNSRKYQYNNKKEIQVIIIYMEKQLEMGHLSQFMNLKI